jgi:site-specific DNA-methyltransferase (adenine-specific)
MGLIEIGLELNKVYNMDCMDGFKEFPDRSVDLIVTDPPYFLPVSHYQTRKQFSRNFADLGIVEHFFKDIFREFERIMKKNGAIYIFCDGQSYPLFYYHLYTFCKSIRPLIWDKKTSINGYSWRHQHEIIIFAEMPEAEPKPSGDGDILRFSAVKVESRQHPAEKPVELLKTLILKSSKEQDIVLDPFAGSGSTLLACKKLNRRFIGFEKGADYAEIAFKRLEQDTTTDVQSYLGESNGQP